MPLSDALLTPDTGALARLRLRVRGVVQGVGFRPFVYGLARRFGLSGWVLNDAEGVLIEVEGQHLEAFARALRAEAPPLSVIHSIESEPCTVDNGKGFEVRHSTSGTAKTMVGADSCVCEDCLNELFDPKDRRHLYPFLNCTNCGPRYTITRQIPYDRKNTSMADFALCPDCTAEYLSPSDRRFHAQPTACPECGPMLSHTISCVMEALVDGSIIALKGLGGFHLLCDARNEAAVQRLRERKGRDAKPFAIMTANLESARQFAKIDEIEAELLASRERPIVLCTKADEGRLAGSIAPGLSSFGVMLPYTPLHYLMFHAAAGQPNGTDWLQKQQELALVVTSANPGGEPLVIGNEEADTRLAEIADLIVHHDRDILIRADDSVVRAIDGAPALIRRARGYTPQSVRLSNDMPSVLALGGHLKNTICVTRGRDAFVSQHIGDVETSATYGFVTETIEHLLDILDVEPVAIACDQHPDFLTTRLAESYDLPLVRVQHHHAHIASVVAEHQLDAPVIGLALDGYGYGINAEAWGGECLYLQGTEYRRIGHLQPLVAPGGDRAAKEPWRMAIALLKTIGREDLIERRFGHLPNAERIASMLDQANPPATSSCGRLFDAVSSLIGVTDTNRYEGEAAMKLESLVTHPYPGTDLWDIQNGVLSFSRLFNALCDLDMRDPGERRHGADLFHGALIDGLTALACEMAYETRTKHVALSGGCLLNRVLAEGLMSEISKRGLTPLYPRQVPPNDGGLSLGQAWIAGRKLLQEN